MPRSLERIPSEDPPENLENWLNPHQFNDIFDGYVDINDARNNWRDDIEGTIWELEDNSGDKNIKITMGSVELKKLNSGKSDVQILSDIWIEGQGVAGIVFYGKFFGGFPICSWSEGYVFTLSTKPNWPSGFYTKFQGNWDCPIGMVIDGGRIFTPDDRYDVKVIVSGHQYFAYVRDDGGTELDWELVAWVSTVVSEFKDSDLVTPDISYDPLSTPIVPNGIGLAIIAGNPGAECHFDDFDIQYNTIYDTFSAPLGQGPGEDGNWIVEEGTTTWEEEFGELWIQPNAVLRFEMGELGWRDFVIEIDIGSPHENPPTETSWFILQFRQVFYLKIKLEPRTPPDASFYWDGLSEEDKIGVSREVMVSTSKNHLQLVVSGSQFLALLNQRHLCSVVEPSSNADPQDGDIRILTSGSTQAVIIDNFYISLKTLGDDFSHTDAGDPPDTDRWTILEGTPKVKNIAEFASKALSLEAGAASSRVVLKSNFLTYLGYTIEFDMLCVKPGASTKEVMGYIGFGYTNDDCYVVCLDSEGGEITDPVTQKVYYERGIRFQKVIGDDWDNPIEAEENIAHGVPILEKNKVTQGGGPPEAALVHIKIRVAENKFSVYMTETYNGDDEILVASTEEIYNFYEYKTPNSCGDIVLYNNKENSIYIDNLYCCLDTDFDGVKDLEEIWGKETLNDVTIFQNDKSAYYRFFLHRIHSSWVEPFKLVFRARFPANDESIYANWFDAKIYADVLDDNHNWIIDNTGFQFYGKGYWQTYVAHTIHTFPADGDPLGKELFIRIRLHDLYSEFTLELDWIGLWHQNDLGQWVSADISDADDFAAKPDTGDYTNYFGEIFTPGEMYGYVGQVERRTIHQRGEWEHYDFDGDDRAERLENRISLRTSIPYGLYCDDFYHTGTTFSTDPDNADYIYYGGRQYKYFNSIDAPIDPETSSALHGDFIFSLEDGAEVFYYKCVNPVSGSIDFELLNIRSDDFDNGAGIGTVWQFFLNSGTPPLGFEQPLTPFCTESLPKYQNGREIIGLTTPEITNERFALLFAGGDGRDFWGPRHIQNPAVHDTENGVTAYGGDSEFHWDTQLMRNALQYQYGFREDGLKNDFDGRNDHIATLWTWRTPWPYDIGAVDDRQYCVGLNNDKSQIITYDEGSQEYTIQTDTQFDNAIDQVAVNYVGSPSSQYAVSSLDGQLKIYSQGGTVCQYDESINKRITGMSWSPDLQNYRNFLTYSYYYYDTAFGWKSVIEIIYKDPGTHAWTKNENNFILTNKIIHDVEWPNSFDLVGFQNTILYTWRSQSGDDHIGSVTISENNGKYYLNPGNDDFIKDPSNNPILGSTLACGRLKLYSPRVIDTEKVGKCVDLVVSYQDEINGFSGFVYIYKDSGDWTAVSKDMEYYMLDIGIKPDSDGKKIVTTHDDCILRTWEWDDVDTFDDIATAEVSFQLDEQTPYCVDYSYGESTPESLLIGTGDRSVDGADDAYEGHVIRFTWDGTNDEWDEDTTYGFDFTDDYYDPDGFKMNDGVVDYLSIHTSAYGSEKFLEVAIDMLIEVMDGNDILFAFYEDHGGYSGGKSSIYTGRIAGPYPQAISSSSLFNLYYTGHDTFDCLYSMHFFSACEIGEFAERLGNGYGNNLVVTATEGAAGKNSWPVDGLSSKNFPINEHDSHTTRRGRNIEHDHSEFSYYVYAVLNGYSLEDNDFYQSKYVMADFDGDGYVSMNEFYNYVFTHDSRAHVGSTITEIPQLNDNGDDVTSDGNDDTDDYRLPSKSPYCDGYMGYIYFI